MSMQGETSNSEDKPSSCLSNLAQDFQNKETYHARKTAQLEPKKSSFSRIDTILINFARKNGEDFLGMQIGDASCQATFLQKIDLAAMEGRFDSITPTGHPNLLNLIGNWVDESHVVLHYEMPGMSLTEIRQFKTLDRIEVATICKKVFEAHFLHRKQ
jgi:hypothetical protein